MYMIAITPDDTEWYTPQYILDKVYNVFPVSLDPCSNEERTVDAQVHYTENVDGLKQLWCGNVFVNPPYGREIGKWTKKFLEEWNNGHIKNAILLVPVKTDTKWWGELSQYLSCWCAVHGRVKFVSPDLEKQTTVGTFASAVILFTRDNEIQFKFYAQFYNLGTLWGRV